MIEKQVERDRARWGGHAHIALVPLSLLLQPCYAQYSFQRDYGSTSIREYGQSVQPDATGSYYVIGGTVEVITYHGDGLQFKVHAQGDTLVWNHVTISDTASLFLEALTRTQDGNLIATGILDLGVFDGMSNYQHAIIKLDTLGGILWSTLVGGAASEWGYQVMEAVNGGYLSAGWGQVTSGPETDFHAVRLDASGDTLWTRSYGNADDPEHAYGLAALSDTSWVLVGKRELSTMTTYIHLVRINDQGDTLWTRTIDGIGNCYAEDAESLPNDHILVTGFSFQGFGCARPLLMELDPSGDLLWYQNYDHGVCEWGQALCKATSGYALWGFDGDDTSWLIRVDDAGNELWSQQFTVGTLSTRGYDVQATVDGGFVMAGTAIFPGNGGVDYQAFVIKTDSLGNVATSTHDLAMDPAISTRLFPNPSDGAATFSFTSTTSGVFSLRLYDTSGKVVRSFADGMSWPPGRNDVPIDLTGLPGGTYSLVLSHEGRSVAVKTIKL